MWATVLLLALWALVGVTVGLRVAGCGPASRSAVGLTHGTVWLAAMAVAVGVSLGLSSLIAALGVLG